MLRRFGVGLLLLLWSGLAYGEDSAFQALLVTRGKELNANYQTCLSQFPANLKEQLRIAQRAWIVFDNKNEAAFGLVGKRRGMTEEDLDRACLPETEARSEMLRTYFSVPNEDLLTLRQDLDRAEQELTAVYKQALSTLGHDEEEKLRDTERAWIEYRDKDIRAHLSDPSGRAPVWASVRSARRRTTQLREFYLQKVSSLPVVAATPTPAPTPPRLNPAARTKLVAEFRDSTQRILAQADAGGLLTEPASLDEVKSPSASLADTITGLRELASQLRQKLGDNDKLDDCRADLATSEALAYLQKATLDIKSADTRSARAELALFHESTPTAPGEAQKHLWMCLNTMWTLCNRLEADAKPHLERAKSSADAGKNGDAVKEYQEAYRICPDPEVAQTLKRLREESLGL